MLTNALKYDILLSQGKRKEREIKKMMNFIMSIPAEFGWATVGFASALVLIMACKIGKCVLEAIKMRLEDEEEECEE